MRLQFIYTALSNFKIHGNIFSDCFYASGVSAKLIEDRPQQVFINHLAAAISQLIKRRVKDSKIADSRFDSRTGKRRFGKDTVGSVAEGVRASFL